MNEKGRQRARRWTPVLTIGKGSYEEGDVIFEEGSHGTAVCISSSSKVEISKIVHGSKTGRYSASEIYVVKWVLLILPFAWLQLVPLKTPFWG